MSTVTHFTPRAQTGNTLSASLNLHKRSYSDNGRNITQSHQKLTLGFTTMPYVPSLPAISSPSSSSSSSSSSLNAKIQTRSLHVISHTFFVFETTQQVLGGLRAATLRALARVRMWVAARGCLGVKISCVLGSVLSSQSLTILAAPPSPWLS